MILYRARTIASRPRRHATQSENTPANRVRGRWFTSDLSAAIAHRDGLGGEAEIIMVDVPDAVAATFCVRKTPVTLCGISAFAHSDCPETDYVLPMFHVMSAEPIAIAGEKRIRDYIDVKGTMPKPIRIVEAPQPRLLLAA